MRTLHSPHSLRSVVGIAAVGVALAAALAADARAQRAAPITPTAEPPTPAPAAAASASPDQGGDPGDAAPASRKTRRIAVYRLDAAGVDERITLVITDSVVAEVRKLQKTTVVGMDEIRAMLDLEAQKQLVGCSDVSCVAEIAEALGVDGIIIGSVAVVGDTINFGLKHIDQHSATTLGQATRRIDSSDPADVLAAIGPVVEELFPDVPLKPGAARGVPPEIALRIHPPPLKPWVFWTLAGTAGASFATGAAFTAWNTIAASTATEKALKSVSGAPVDGAELNRDLENVRGSFVALTIAYGIGGVVATGAAVSAAFVDWDDAAGAVGAE